MHVLEAFFLCNLVVLRLNTSNCQHTTPTKNIHIYIDGGIKRVLLIDFTVALSSRESADGGEKKRRKFDGDVRPLKSAGVVMGVLRFLFSKPSF